MAIGNPWKPSVPDRSGTEKSAPYTLRGNHQGKSFRGWDSGRMKMAVGNGSGFTWLFHQAQCAQDSRRTRHRARMLEPVRRWRRRQRVARYRPMSPPPISADAVFVTDISTGTELFAQNADEPLPPASLTKIVSALVVLDRANLDDTVEILEDDLVSTEESQVGLMAGDRLSVRDLLHGMLIPSGNDATLALARHVGTAVLGDGASARAGGCRVRFDDERQGRRAWRHSLPFFEPNRDRPRRACDERARRRHPDQGCASEFALFGDRGSDRMPS